jgi:hypothetical protein
MAVSVRLALPVLVRVTAWELLVLPTICAEKLSGDDKLTSGCVPVPLKLTVCGLLGALSVNERLPDAVPPAVGVNVIATVQVPDAATGVEVEQVLPELAMAKGPVAPMAVSVRLALPVLVRVTVCELLVVPTN